MTQHDGFAAALADAVAPEWCAEDGASAQDGRLRTVLQTAHEGIWLVDREARTLFINERMARLLGCSAAEMLGRPVTAFCFEEDAAHHREHIAGNLAGRAEHFDTRFRHRDGGALPLSAVTSPVRDRAGNIVGALGIFSDLAERKAAEAEMRRLNETLEQRVDARTRQLREANRRLLAEIEERRQAEAALRRERRFSEQLIESAANGIIAIDRDFRHSVWNAGVEAMTGLSRAQVLGRTVFEVLPAIAGTPVETAWRRALQGRPTTLNERRYGIEETGRSGFFDASFTPLVDADGEITGAIAFLRDITERRRMEETLRQSQKLEAIGQLTGGVAHDFNNLLSAILGNLELIAQRTRSAKIGKLVANASRAAERGARLTQELLAFSRKQHLAAKPVDLNALLAGMSDLLTRTIGAMVRIERRLGADVWLVLADPIQLELVILNLAINARDAMPQGGVLTIETANLPAKKAARNYVVLTVRDTGFGMSEEVKARALEPFFTTKEEGKGTGLGLSMIYGVVTQLGGTVEIDSAPGSGTIVRLLLPQAAAEVPRAPDGGCAAKFPRSDAAAAGTTILLVDDDPDVRSIAATYLQNRGHRVIEAANGRRALEIIDREPDIALMIADYAMPGMNGVDLAASARHKRPDLRILFTTGYADAGALEEAERADLVLRKPFRLADLATKVEWALTGDTHRRALQAAHS